MIPRILDVSTGSRGVWFDKDPADTVFIDVRPSSNVDALADSRRLPFADGSFDLIVFDPPHVNFGANANMTKNYGHHTTAAIRHLVTDTAAETHRVSRPGALMAFKWNDHDQPLAKILNLMAFWWEPLFGHQVAKRLRGNETWWCMLRRLEA